MKREQPAGSLGDKDTLSNIKAQPGLTRRDVIAAAAVLGIVPVSSAQAASQVYLENQKQGNPRSEWDLTAASTAIEGFAAQMSVNHGETVQFKIKTAIKSYRIDIYRLGYYKGSGARKVASILPSSFPTQPSPLKNAAIGLVDAGNWSVTAS